MKNDFTLTGYETILTEALKSNYSFLDFKNLNDEIFNKICYLRHDIDADVSAAYKMAEVESKLGIKATYFLMLRSPVYNLFSRANQRLVENILGLKHNIGLHFDENFSCQYDTPLQDLIEKELKMLEINFGNKITIVSFHQPSTRVLTNNIKLSNVVHTYDQELFKGIHYVSDSNKNWRSVHPYHIFRKSMHNKLQLLIHPMWWVQTKNINTRRVWKKTLINNFEQTQKQLVETEGAFGNPLKIKLL
ncbi:MAG TPA: hypothetical protein VFI29_05990 [Hanamia sp.]|nr:hypothetical protein [Hanamia sp.]